MLKMTRAQLAAAAGVGEQTIFRFEEKGTELREDTELRLIACFEAHGIRFKNGNRPTVILEKGEQ